jgi:penicillin-insensitive murein endopeptidase
MLSLVLLWGGSANADDIRTLPAEHQPDSVSCGATNRGALSDAVALAERGTGFVVKDPWRSRGLHYGTKEMVALLERAAARVHREHPGARLAIGDLSAEHGGPVGGHRSHQSGRDVDLIYYALDEGGAPFEPDQHMAYYGPRGFATYATSPNFVKGIPVRFFDMARNWALTRALLTDPQVQVEKIFVSSRVRRWLLHYAIDKGEPEELIKKARQLLRRPGDVRGHNDHMHVRIACSDSDIALGRCRNGSSSRRLKRWYRRRVACPQPIMPPTTQIAAGDR